jgi:glycosyltransferase involved in cell wall biosynthesis
VNRLISTNLAAVTPDALPPPRHEGPARILFIHGNILGFRNVAKQIEHFAAERADVDAVHIHLVAPPWMKVLGKSLPVPGGWDFHSFRYLRMWGAVIARWFRGPLPVQRFDVVHVMTQGNAWAMLSIRGPDRPRFAVNIDATAVRDVTEFGYAPRARAPFIAAERRMFAAADLLVCRNRWASRSLREDFGVPAERIHVAPNSLAAPAAWRWDGRAAHGGATRIVFVGNNWKRKGGDFVLRVHQRSLADRTELHVLGAKMETDRSARNVVWHGFVPRERLLGEILPSMDVFVLASRFDMLPWALLEAAGAGLPLVAPRVGGIPEVVADGETGLLFEAGDEAGLERALRRLVDDPALRETLGRGARRRLAAKFDPAITYPALLDRLVALADDGTARGVRTEDAAAKGPSA